MASGRPTDLTQELAAIIVRDIESGVAGEVAAVAAGVAAPTFYRWMARGRTELGSIFEEFRIAVTRARAEAEKRAVRCVTSAMAEDPKLAIEWLRRQRHRRWEPVAKAALVATVRGEQQARPTKTLVNELRAEADRLETQLLEERH